ncbi:helix-turn-helix domain-containing protein [Rhodocista pekingensis]|uniref:Helix-turn-helix domain-containing protein n=1 Tax=Rhodocista pekingensis TaxID=201185 RepID=A0ABW2KYM8_9PROT
MDVRLPKALGDLPANSRDADDDDDARPSLRPIRSLLRGLQCLMVLNTRDGVTVSEIARAAKLPRTTAHRILETLCDGGYVIRDPLDERYRATILVRSLSDGFGDQSWVREIAKPALDALCRQVLYPMALATPSGLTMLVRETTDRQSPLALERYSAGVRVPMIYSASGRLHLALSAPSHRQAMLDILERMSTRPDSPLRNRAEFERELDLSRSQGYAIYHRPPNKEATVSVPIHVGDSPIGYLAMRYIASAVTPKDLVTTYLPRLRETATGIGDALATIPNPQWGEGARA